MDALSQIRTLIAQAETRPLDLPRLHDDGPDTEAAALARQGLQSGEGDQAALWAALGNALRLGGPESDAEARDAFTRALALDPDQGQWWFDLGLLHKWRARYDDALECTRKAQALLGPERAVCWNIAIAATALGQGQTAVDAWRAVGLPAVLDPNTGMPWIKDMPPLRVRTIARRDATGAPSALPNTAVGFELLWVAPMSPCHGVVQSPSFADALVDYGDVLLWDGAPVAQHHDAQGSAPVFAVLEVLVRGDERRWPFIAVGDTPNPLDRLAEHLPSGARVFVRNERAHTQCTACDQGQPLDTHTAPDTPIYGKLIIPRSVDAQRAVKALKEALPAVAIPKAYETQNDSRRAGQEHQAWAGIERRALKKAARS